MGDRVRLNLDGVLDVEAVATHTRIHDASGRTERREASGIQR